MLSNLIFCLNGTIPVFLLMILGMIFMELGVFNEEFVKKLNSFVFIVGIPVLVFNDLYKEDFYSVWDTRYVLFCLGATALSILITFGISFFLKDKTIQGEFIQASYRSSAAILGITLVQNLYGDSGMTPLMILGSVPLYNAMAVIILSFFKPDRKPVDKALIVKTGKGIVTNPIILGIFIGLLWSVLSIPVPVIMDKTVESVARIATPLGLMGMGASLDIKKALSGIKTAGLCSFIKLIGLGLIFVPMAVMLGFSGTKLAAVLIMCCSPTTVSCFIMAKGMDHDGTLTGSAVMLTTFLSAFTLTGWLFVLKSMGLL